MPIDARAFTHSLRVWDAIGLGAKPCSPSHQDGLTAVEPGV
jgi:hypothetical protein